MTLHKVELELALELLSPLHIGAGYGVAGYLDARVVTDENGYPYVPGSSLKGRLRYYLAGLLPALGAGDGQPGPETNLFGERRPEEERELAGTLHFGDLRLTPAWRDLFDAAGLQPVSSGLITERRANVMLSRLRGVALERRLFSVEAAPLHVGFTGGIAGHLPDCGRLVTVGGQSCPRDLALLVVACQALTHLGGRKSRGLGRCRLTIVQGTLRVGEQPVEPAQLLEALR